jgi:hypothetical protein
MIRDGLEERRKGAEIRKGPFIEESCIRTQAKVVMLRVHKPWIGGDIRFRLEFRSTGIGHPGFEIVALPIE